MPKKQKTSSTTNRNPIKIGEKKRVPSIKKRAVSRKLAPNKYSFANINLILRHRLEGELEENEFKFLLATAVQEIHGEFANQLDLLSFKLIDNQNYSSIIRFKTTHYSRVITALLLFNEWKGKDCRIDITKIAQTPCFLSI